MKGSGRPPAGNGPSQDGPEGEAAGSALPRLARIDLDPAPGGGAVLRLELEDGGQLAVHASLDQLDLLADHLDDLLQDGADAD